MTTSSDPVQLVPTNGWDQRLLVCRCGTLVDTFIVVTMRYLVLIDTLLNAATATALLAIAGPWLAGRQLLVVNSHADWDHAWGNHAVAGAPIIASRRCAERLRSSEMAGQLADMRTRTPGRFDDVRLTPPTVLFEQRLTIDGGDLTLELFATPGHTSDHVAVYLPEIGTLLAGDAAELPFPFVESAASLPALRDSLARMDALKPAMALYCHAPETSGPAVLAQNMAYFDTVERRCQAALGRGVPAQPAPEADVEQLVGFPYAEAVPATMDAAALADFYRPGHHAALRAMLEHLAMQGAGLS